MTFLKKLFWLIFCCCLLLWVSQAYAQQNQVTEPQEQTEAIEREAQEPEEVVQEDKVPVLVEYDDMDNMGRRLVFNLRERFSASELFRLSNEQGEKIKVIISSQEEFPARPGLSSIYSIVWTFSYGDDVLDNYLEMEVGQISNQYLPRLAESLVAKTDEIYNRYSYLFD